MFSGLRKYEGVICIFRKKDPSGVTYCQTFFVVVMAEGRELVKRVHRENVDEQAVEKPPGTLIPKMSLCDKVKNSLR